ncbi:MAG: hypothetical protein J6W87_03370 [Clostridia bacterium]|nr:hypothetical protein [Clostridia bacterium]
MDNKINRKRLSNFLSYEWILMLVVVLASIFAFELIYTISATRVSTGQNFKYYLDKNLSSDVADFYVALGYEPDKNGKTFSYEILELSSESVMFSDEVLVARLSVQEGDVIFSDVTEDENGSARAKTLVDNYPIMPLDELLGSAKEYLEGFKENGTLSEDLIVRHFNERMKKDNRFRTEEQKAAGRLLEICRIQKLAKDVEDFEKIFAAGNEGLFFNYTKYAQTLALNPESKDAQSLYDREVSAGRENAKYGIRLAALSYEGTDKKDVSRFFQRADTGTAEDVIVMVFDFTSYQPDLQFETISFIDTILRECSDLLD